MPDDLTRYSLRELLATHVAVLDEIEARGFTRTRASLAGELGEHLALAVYGGELATAGLKSIDLIDDAGRRVQVKTRALKSGVHRIYVLSDFDFDTLIAVMFDLDTFDVSWARELTAAEAVEIARWRKSSPHWAIGTRKAMQAGVDVTERLREAYKALDSIAE